MKLYFVCKDTSVNYEEYDSFVVAAENEESVLKFFPEHFWELDDEVAIKCIGDSNSLVEEVILSSFNAG